MNFISFDGLIWFNLLSHIVLGKWRKNYEKLWDDSFIDDQSDLFVLRLIYNMVLKKEIMGENHIMESNLIFRG